jgi:hypothetical protein
VRYKVGDKVKVKSLEELKNNYLYDEEEDIVYKKGKYSGCRFIKPMQKYCGEIITIELVDGELYYNSKIGYSFEDWMLEDVVEETKPNSTPRNKYDREILPNTYVDVYDVLRAFEVTDQALGHLIKKALAVGKRGHKTAEQDYKDILDSAQRAYDQYIQWNEVNNG